MSKCDSSEYPDFRMWRLKVTRMLTTT